MLPYTSIMFGIASLLILNVHLTNQVNCNCNDLLMGQYQCPHPGKLHIDPHTQQLRGCTKENKARVWCLAVDGINCSETGNNTFTQQMPCRWTNGYHFDTTLLLSVFLGMFGVDRFYLGYPAIGLMKFCTLGGMFLGQLIDIILIATQVVEPADGSAYIIPYYGAGVTIPVMKDNIRAKFDKNISIRSPIIESYHYMGGGRRKKLLPTKF